ncbi:HAD family hydrolase [Mucilaginibacter paludis]|uniref:Haloacid dehalogenase domain protein hydrolase n=1 Tax=Mucilaginibacter paludis DSM 18603 TaxID=714943 RepID=H1Y1W2_9SPHI|nr:HAD hydrolase-like protein [Mucilaginibacter paludis]EHQ25665.1 Haloacid dehalogenase domain protein hydrolase [Mucilaginibacter paludis DSM 18603]
MLTYADLEPRKKALVLELDNVLYPEKDYLLQVYYLFASFLEYKELFDARVLTKLMTKTLEEEGATHVFNRVQERFNINEQYRYNFNLLHQTARLPLKLLLYQQALTLLQEAVVDRKQLFILTNGDPQQQLNKIRQMEWHGLEQYLTCYFADEIKPKPEPDALHYILKKHNLERRDIVMMGNSEADQLCAEASGVDFIEIVHK